MLECVRCRAVQRPCAWRCADCGGVLDLRLYPHLDPHPDQADGPVGHGEGMWRYAPWLPASPLTLGEPTTPLVALDGRTLIKAEGALPTGSFKDRGSAVMVGWLAEHGARSLVVDSSGNAGASIAAYAARARLACHVYVPENASAGKLAQIRAYGAVVHPIAGARQRAAEAAMSSDDGVYASHAWNPLFLCGTQTIAFEIWEQLGGTAPDAIITPVGAGTLFLGAHRGFRALHDRGLIDRPPRMYGVVPADVGNTAAEGIRISAPPRREAITAAASGSGGGIIAVDDNALWQAHKRLAGTGFYVEPTSAIALAGTRALMASGSIRTDELVVVPMTATGLKTNPG